MKDYGIIGIKTKNEALLIITYLDETHLFNFTHKIKVEIVDNEISIKSLFLSINKIIDKYEKYDSLLESMK